MPLSVGKELVGELTYLREQNSSLMVPASHDFDTEVGLLLLEVFRDNVIDPGQPHRVEAWFLVPGPRGRDAEPGNDPNEWILSGRHAEPGNGPGQWGLTAWVGDKRLDVQPFEEYKGISMGHTFTIMPEDVQDLTVDVSYRQPKRRQVRGEGPIRPVGSDRTEWRNVYPKRAKGRPDAQDQNGRPDTGPRGRG